MDVNTPEVGYRWNELPRLNETIYKRHRRKFAATVLEQFERVHQRTLSLINKMDDEELTTLGYYSWTGKSWTLSDYLRGNTASHYR